MAQDDLDHRGGDVRAEKSLLLVARDRATYLPLFPLSLFHFQLRSQGVYFLQRSHWEGSPSGRRLRKACYVAYESGLEDHEEGPGEPASRSLEQHVARLESLSSGGRVVVEEDPGRRSESVPDPVYELPEVRQEQQFHLRTFAGREALLGRSPRGSTRPPGRAIC